MKPVGWCVIVTVCCISYHIVTGANLRHQPDESDAQSIMGYIAEKVETQYRQARDVSEEDDDDRESRQVQQQPLFPRLSMQYHNYTRYVLRSYHLRWLITMFAA